MSDVQWSGAKVGCAAAEIGGGVRGYRMYLVALGWKPDMGVGVWEYIPPKDLHTSGQSWLGGMAIFST
jgi:hypothetical protein